jgi:sialate O-acetylesterase
LGIDAAEKWRSNWRMTKRFFSLGCFVALFTLTSFFAQAETKLPSILGSHMVLQQGAACPIWGWDDSDKVVTVAFAGQKHTAKVGDDGRWQVTLAAMKANAKGQTLTVRGSTVVELKDVLIGEVWLCSGQSNMEWRVRQSTNAKEEIASAKHPLIRHIKIERKLSTKPESDVPSRDGWQVCSPKVVANFTAVGYYFGRYLQKELNVPIGLIGSNWGGTKIEPWTPPVGFKSVPALVKSPPAPNTRPSQMYNAMISPLLPYTIKGALWYQGESNNGEGMLYYEKMRALISGWRSVWHNAEMPFLFVQLAPYKYGGDPKRLAGIWQAQLTTVKTIPHTGMAVTTDITTLRNIHPPNKQDVGKRLALWALAKDYGKKDIVYSGPLFRSLEVKDGRAVLKFDHAHGLNSRDGKPLTNFEALTADGKWLPAGAYVHGNTVIVSGKAIRNPQAVRFGWDQLATPNLINGAGLPASPFTSRVGKGL